MGGKKSRMVRIRVDSVGIFREKMRKRTSGLFKVKRQVWKTSAGLRATSAIKKSRQ